MTDSDVPAPPQAFGLALSGGSVRGLAHLGVLDVLAEHGLWPGWLAGTSAGSIAAAFAAFGFTPEETEETLAEVGWKTLSRARPFASIGVVTNEGLGDLIVDVIGEVDIRDAQVPLAVVATDINTGERVVLDRGPLAPAVRASCCIPGLYAPVEVDGRMLVDGSLTENVPARTAREMGAPLVVAVTLGLDLPFDEVKNWVHVIINALDIAINSQMRAELDRHADIVIRPDVAHFSKVRPRDRTELIEAGRESTEAEVPRIVEALARSGLLGRQDGALPEPGLFGRIASFIRGGEG